MYRVYLEDIHQMPDYILESQFNIKLTSPAATVYLCQLSSKLQDQLFIYWKLLEMLSIKLEIIVVRTECSDKPAQQSILTWAYFIYQLTD